MKRFVRTVASVVGSVILLGASAPLASAQTGEAPLQSRWSNKLTGGGTSTWTFTPQGGGRYNAQEVGMGNARGTAVRTGNHIHIDFTTAVAAGTYDVDLNAAGTDGVGQVVLTQGALTGKTFRAAFRGLDPRATFGARQPSPSFPGPSAGGVGLPAAFQPHPGAAVEPVGTFPPDVTIPVGTFPPDVTIPPNAPPIEFPPSTGPEPSPGPPDGTIPPVEPQTGFPPQTEPEPSPGPG